MRRQKLLGGVREWGMAPGMAHILRKAYLPDPLLWIFDVRIHLPQPGKNRWFGSTMGSKSNGPFCEAVMNASQVLVHGVLNSDGTLKLDETPQLPPGPVEVLIRAQPPADTEGDTWWQYLQRGRVELLAQGYIFRTKEEIDEDRAPINASDSRR